MKSRDNPPGAVHPPGQMLRKVLTLDDGTTPIAALTLSGAGASAGVILGACSRFSLTVLASAQADGDFWLESSDHPDPTEDAHWNEIPNTRSVNPTSPLSFNVGNAYYRHVRLCWDLDSALADVRADINSPDSP